ncbi:SHOCT domain-containing protein [Kitasatospora sp. NPDC101183]|uniref:SHOCT domain-containing protein n=1 Tax=Kitasatospora sp. NPDC101183 TaxID=3364100 RepID=UPI0038075F8B
MGTYHLASQLAADYPLLNIFWTMLELFLWILWIFLLFKIITDIFRSHDLSGWGKAGWLVLVILLPLIGVIAYLIARGDSMHKRDLSQAQQTEAAVKAYIRDAATPEAGGPRTHVDDLAALADLHTRGLISDEEFQRAKDKLLV